MRAQILSLSLSTRVPDRVRVFSRRDDSAARLERRDRSIRRETQRRGELLVPVVRLFLRMPRLSLGARNSESETTTTTTTLPPPLVLARESFAASLGERIRESRASGQCPSGEPWARSPPLTLTLFCGVPSRLQQGTKKNAAKESADWSEQLQMSLQTIHTRGEKTAKIQIARDCGAGRSCKSKDCSCNADVGPEPQPRARKPPPFPDAAAAISPRSTIVTSSNPRCRR